MAIADEKYVVLAVAGATTRARVVLLSDGRLGLWPTDELVVDGQAVTVASPDPGSPTALGTADVVRSGRAFNETCAKMRLKYGRRTRPSHIDVVVVVRLEE